MANERALFKSNEPRRPLLSRFEYFNLENPNRDDKISKPYCKYGNAIYIQDRCLGSGSYGEVHVFTKIKSLTKEEKEYESLPNNVVVKTTLCTRLDEKRLVTKESIFCKAMYGIGLYCGGLQMANVAKTPTYILMPFFEGSLLCDFNFVSIRQLLLVLIAIVDSAIKMHHKYIIHGDIKNNNLIIEEIKDRNNTVLNYEAIFIDFTFSVFQEEESVTIGVAGDYHAPELQNKIRAEFNQDIFSIGVMLKEICDNHRHLMSEDLYKRLLSCCEKMKEYRPEARITAEKAKEYLNAEYQRYNRMLNNLIANRDNYNTVYFEKNGLWLNKFFEYVTTENDLTLILKQLNPSYHLALFLQVGQQHLNSIMPFRTQLCNILRHLNNKIRLPLLKIIGKEQLKNKIKRDSARFFDILNTLDAIDRIKLITYLGVDLLKELIIDTDTLFNLLQLIPNKERLFLLKLFPVNYLKEIITSFKKLAAIFNSLDRDDILLLYNHMGGAIFLKSLIDLTVTIPKQIGFILNYFYRQDYEKVLADFELPYLKNIINDSEDLIEICGAITNPEKKKVFIRVFTKMIFSENNQDIKLTLAIIDKYQDAISLYEELLINCNALYRNNRNSKGRYTGYGFLFRQSREEKISASEALEKVMLKTLSVHTLLKDHNRAVKNGTLGEVADRFLKIHNRSAGH